MKNESGLAQMARHVAEKGRNGDTMLAHITPQEARMLMLNGGSGTINPDTGLPEFFLKKLKKTVSKAVSAPVKLATSVASSATKAPLKVFSGLTGVGTKGLQKTVSSPFTKAGGLAAQGLGALAKQPLNFASGAVNLVADPVDQFEQIGRETARTAQSPLLPIAASFVPGVGPALAGGISAAQAGYRNRNDGLLDILGNAALAGGTSYLGAQAGQNALGKINIAGNPYAAASSGLSGLASSGAGLTPASGFNLGTGNASLANSLGLNLAGQSQALPAAFNLGTGAGSIAGSLGLNLAGLGSGAATGFDLASGTGSLANTLGLNLGQTGTPGSFGVGDVGDIVGPIIDATDKPSSADSLLGLGAGAAGLYGLLSLLKGSFPDQKPITAPEMSDQDKANYNRPSQALDWAAIKERAAREGLTPAEAIARNWDQIAGVNAQPVPLRNGGMPPRTHNGALSTASKLFRGPGSGRADLIDAKVSDGEYVLDAETVALLGDGSTDAGAKALDGMREKIRSHKGRALSRGKISPDAKSPLAYLKGAK